MTSLSGGPALRLEHKAAIVTGASSGIGAAIAHAFALAGARVVAVGRDRDRLATTAETVRAAGAECREIVVDVTEDVAADRIVEGSLDAFGAIDCVVPNAGIFRGGHLLETTLEELDLQYATHIRAAFALTKAAVPHMLPGSSIVFIGSNLAHHGHPGTSAYSAVKGAVEVMARTLAVELGPKGIRVNAVSPGLVRTPMTVDVTQDASIEAAIVEATPIRRVGEVEDVAAAVTYLSSDLAGYVAGATLVIDGGSSAD